MNPLEKAFQLIKEHPDLWSKDYSEPATEESIKLAEELIGRQFPEEYRDFLHTFADLEFGGNQIKGIWKNQLDGGGESNVVSMYLEYREENYIPEYLVPIYSLGDGEEYCLNYNQLNRNGDPKITAYVPSPEEDYYPHEVLYDSFSECLLDLVDNAINGDLDW